MNDILRNGWIPFSNFCEVYGIKRDGNEYRKLKKLDESYKRNLSTSTTPYWVVDEEQTKIMFNVR